MWERLPWARFAYTPIWLKRQGVYPHMAISFETSIPLLIDNVTQKHAKFLNECTSCQYSHIYLRRLGYILDRYRHVWNQPYAATAKPACRHNVQYRSASKKAPFSLITINRTTSSDKNSVLRASCSYISSRDYSLPMRRIALQPLQIVVSH